MKRLDFLKGLGALAVVPFLPKVTTKEPKQMGNCQFKNCTIVENPTWWNPCRICGYKHVWMWQPTLEARCPECGAIHRETNYPYPMREVTYSRIHDGRFWTYTQRID
jgi:hypothetical protein